MSEDLGRAVIYTVFNHPDIEVTEMSVLAKIMALATASILGTRFAVAKEHGEYIDPRYPQMIRQVMLETFAHAFDEQIAKGDWV